MKKSVLITGGNGQLGSELKELSAGLPHTFHFIDIEDADLTMREQAMKVFSAAKPDYIVNCAAYTAVDKAEEEKELAWRVNAGIPENIAAYLQEHPETRTIHISTDYVFGGYEPRPLTETDPTVPESVYGQTKLEGEKILGVSEQVMVIRTSWLYSAYGRNFVKSMVGHLRERDQLKIVFDQVGTPTYAGDLAAAILHIVGVESRKEDLFEGGIYHYSNEGVASWYDLVMEIREFTGSNCSVVPIETREYPLPAPRPWYSVMNKVKIRQQFGLEIPYWKESLKTCLEKLNSNESK